MSSDTGPLDDAALVRPEPDPSRSLVLTLDVITPIVDDARAFGRIAAANALSDVYAMGGRPEVALTFVGVPDAVGLDVLEQILRGVTEKATEAGCAIVGGHSIRDGEPKAGLAVVGSVETQSAWTHRRATAGQHLVLTKPIGTGLIAQAARSDRAARGSVEEATRWMETINSRACELGRAHGATAATDVTGFGLLGHLHHLVAASGLSARVDVGSVLLMSGALDAARAGLVPGGSQRNLRYVEGRLHGAGGVEPALLTALADAQTSGGLLLAVPAAESARLVATLGDGAAAIGEIRAGSPGSIELTA